jgi:hypothetical protein
MSSNKYIVAVLCVSILVLTVFMKNKSPLVRKILANPVFQMLFLFMIFIKSQTDLQFGVLMGIVFVLVINQTSLDEFKEKFTEITQPYIANYFQKITDVNDTFVYEHHKCDMYNGFERAECLSKIIPKLVS